MTTVLSRLESKCEKSRDLLITWSMIKWQMKNGYSYGYQNWQGGSFWGKKCYPDEKNVIHKVTKEFIKNLLEITVTLVQILLENIIHTFLLSSSFLNVVWRKRIFWILLSCKFKNIPRIFVVDIAVERPVIDKIKPSLEPLLSLLQSLQRTFRYM